VMDKRNSEGCPDPTTAEYKQYRSMVYICSPFAGDAEYNISRARRYCRFAVSEGCIPLAPHLHYPQFMDDLDKESRELGLTFAQFLLTKCDEVWVFGNRISDGMAREIAKAKELAIPIRFFSEKCEEVMRHENRGR